MKKIVLLFVCSFIGSYTSFSQVLVSTLAGNSAAGGGNGTGAAASFNNPDGITLINGDVIVSDGGNHRIRRITPAGVVTNIAGSGTAGFVNGTGSGASFSSPAGLCADASGNIYVADYYNNMIRKITPAGVVSTLAGTGAMGYADGPPTLAQFNHPSAVIGDNSGNIYVSDQDNHRIRRITPTGSVSTVAGSGTPGFTNGTGTAAAFNAPRGICYDGNGALYLTDINNNCIRKIVLTTSVVTTFAGTGATGSADGQANVATFMYPTGIHIGGTGDLYIADFGNHKIRKISTSLVVSTVAGTGVFGFADGNGTVAQFDNPMDLRYYNNTIYVIDYFNNRVRKIDPCTLPSNPTDVTPAGNYSICAGTSGTLLASGTGTINWYSSNTSTTAIATGSNYSTASTLAAGAYTVYAEDATACGPGLRTEFDFTVAVCCNTVNPPVNTTASANTTVCAGSSTTLSASSSGTVNWYTASSGGTAISSGTAFITSNTLAAGSYTLYAEAASSCTVSTRTPVVFQVTCCGVNAPSNLTPVANTTVCAGNSTTLTAGGTGTISWYTASSGGSAIATGTTYVTSAILPQGVYTIYAGAATSCSTSPSRTPFTFTVVLCCFAPDAPQNTTPAANTQVCMGTPAVLTATSNGNISWFNSGTGGSAISTGSLYTTSNALPAGAYAYYAEAASSCSVSASRTAISFTVNNCTTGINALSYKTLVTTVYPNPATEQVTVAFNNSTAKTIEVMDITGRVLLNTSTSEPAATCNLQAFAPGIYYVRIVSIGKTEVVKVVKE